MSIMKVSMAYIPCDPSWANKDRIYRNAVTFERDGDYRKAHELYQMVLEVLKTRPNHKPHFLMFVAARCHVCSKHAGIKAPPPEILMQTTTQ